MFRCLALFFFIFLLSIPVEGGVRWKDGRWIDTIEDPKASLREHYQQAISAYACEDWQEAARHFRIITCNFADSACGPEAAFYLGVCEYNLEEYEDANNAFSCYLKYRKDAEHFFEAIEFKFCIAELFRSGVKRRIFSYNQLPKWASGYSQALSIYDEIVFAVPNHAFAAKSLYSKAKLFVFLSEYREAVDTYRLFLRRFPKHEMAANCYLGILSCYLDMAQIEYQNPDILAFAQLTLNKFETLYPRDEHLDEARAITMQIKEYYAYGFYELGRYYERSGWQRAAAIYYHTCQSQFPDTQVAACAGERFQCVGYLLPQVLISEPVVEKLSVCDTGVPEDIEFD